MSTFHSYLYSENKICIIYIVFLCRIIEAMSMAPAQVTQCVYDAYHMFSINCDMLHLLSMCIGVLPSTSMNLNEVVFTADESVGTLVAALDPQLNDGGFGPQGFTAAWDGFSLSNKAYVWTRTLANLKNKETQGIWQLHITPLIRGPKNPQSSSTSVYARNYSGNSGRAAANTAAWEAPGMLWNSSSLNRSFVKLGAGNGGFLQSAHLRITGVGVSQGSPNTIHKAVSRPSGVALGQTGELVDEQCLNLEAATVCCVDYPEEAPEFVGCYTDNYKKGGFPMTRDSLEVRDGRVASSADCATFCKIYDYRCSPDHLCG